MKIVHRGVSELVPSVNCIVAFGCYASFLGVLIDRPIFFCVGVACVASHRLLMNSYMFDFFLDYF